MSKLIRNSINTPLCVQIFPHVPTHLPAAQDPQNPGIGVRTPALCRLTDAHYAALLALDSQDPRRVALSMCELVADNGTFPV